MATYAIVIDGVCVNIAGCEDPGFAADQGWVGPIDALSPVPGVGWSYANSTWTAPVVTPPTPTAAQQAATQLADMLTQVPALSSQVAADEAMFAATPVGSTIQAEHIAAFGRMVTGFSTTMTALQAVVVATGVVPG